jgi:hypothetical protein
MRTHSRITQAAIFLGLLLVGLVCFRFGFYLFHRPEARGPASVQRVYDYSSLQGDALKRAILNRVLSATRIVQAGNSRGVELGHFLLKGQNGVVDGCAIYKDLELKFVAGDMAVSGEPPMLKMSGPCRTDKESLAILPLMFDYEPVLRTPASDKDLSEGPDKAIQLSFENISDNWPRVWVLHGIRLAGEGQDPIEIHIDEIRRVLGRPPSMEWSQ